MNLRYALVTVILVVLIAASGCTGTPAPAPSGTTAGTQAQTTVASLVPGPTDAIPDYNAVTIDVGEKDYNGMIPVIFQGGMGQIHVKKIDVKLTRVDGSVQTTTVGTKKGDMAELQGTRGEGSKRGQADRIEVWVSMDNGMTYKLVDVLREYRSRG